MRQPDFFLIGAMKAGTTSVYRYLAQHPEIFLPRLKEPNFHRLGGLPVEDLPPELVRHSTLTRSAYAALFHPARADQRVGEGSIRYLDCPRAVARIAEERPEARFIAILREPAERAWSHFEFARERGIEPYRDFRRALDEEDERFARDGAVARFGYLRGGLYDRHLRVWDRRFPPERFCLLLYEDLCRDPRAALRRIFEHLDVDPDFAPDTSRRYNVTGVARSSALGRLLRQRRLREWVTHRVPAAIASPLGRTLRRRPGKLDPEIRARLIDGAREDVLRLQDRLGRDLSAWLRTESDQEVGVSPQAAATPG